MKIEDFREGLGRLSFAASLLVCVKAFLGPLWSCCSVMPKGAAIEVPSMVIMVLRWLADYSWVNDTGRTPPSCDRRVGAGRWGGYQRLPMVFCTADQGASFLGALELLATTVCVMAFQPDLSRPRHPGTIGLVDFALTNFAPQGTTLPHFNGACGTARVEVHQLPFVVLSKLKEAARGQGVWGWPESQDTW